MANKLQVGQTLYWVPSYSGLPKEGEVTVTKVGRKYAALSNGRRIEIATMRSITEYTGECNGTCYASAEVYRAEKAARIAWGQLRGEMTIYPRGITVEQIYQAAALLGLNIGDENGNS